MSRDDYADLPEDDDSEWAADLQEVFRSAGWHNGMGDLPPLNVILPPTLLDKLIRMVLPLALQASNEKWEAALDRIEGALKKTLTEFKAEVERLLDQYRGTLMMLANGIDHMNAAVASLGCVVSDLDSGLLDCQRRLIALEALENATPSVRPEIALVT